MKAILLLLPLVLVGCDASQRPNADICLAPLSPAARADLERIAPNATAQQNWNASFAAADNCVHSLAYRLAHEQDGAEVVAQAIVNQCATQVASVVTADAQLQGENPEPGTDAFDQFNKEARDQITQQAAYYVIQARAGHCAAPKADPLPDAKK
jgi:hypothetical protein